MATNTGNPFVDALAGKDPWGETTLDVFFEDSGAGGAWTTQEKILFINAYSSWYAVANILFKPTNDRDQAHLVERKERDSTWQGPPGSPPPPPAPNADHEYPGQPSIGRYNTQKAQWNVNDLVVGGTVYSTFVHELGHALGLEHPHPDDGADDKNFPGVTGDSDQGDNNLNRRIFSVMSYVRDTDPTANNYGRVATPMAFDIAAIQQLYGARTETNAGDTTYTLKDVNGVGTYYSCIWDGGGLDRIVYNGSKDATIDLRPATLRNEAGGGGFLSSVTGINGGFTIAADFTNALANSGGETGVVIENAVGSSGNDKIRGNAANNWLVGGLGRDVLEGFDGHDTLDGGNGGGEMYGGGGNDELWAGSGADRMDGGDGIDRMNFSRSTAGIQVTMTNATEGKVVDGAWETVDTFVSVEDIVASGFDDQISLGGGRNLILARGGHDQVDGGDGADTIYGEGGNDTLRGGLGSDWIDGGAGFDIASFGSAVTVNLATGVHSGEAAGDSFVGIEQYSGSPQADTFVASNSYGARFAGGDGVDYFYGGNHDDWLQGGKGTDYVSGGNGSDTVSYADAQSGITAEMYFDADTTLGHTEGKITAGEWGLDTLVSVENVEGSNYADSLYGDERSNTLSGLGGDDYIEGDGGGTPQGSYDYLLGGAGNDRIVVGMFDTALGGADFDTVSFVGGPISLNFNTNTFTVGGYGIHLGEFESYIGTTGADVIYGAAHGEYINLGDGNDVLSGQGGDDFLYTGGGYDIMDGGAGRDTIVFHKAMVADWQAGMLDADIAESWANWEVIQGSAGNDRIRTNSWGFAVELRGGAGNDVLAAGVSGAVADTLFGEAGNDHLDGGAGADRLDGGAGNDIYALGADTSDTITDASGIDTITSTISRSLAGYAAIENLTLLGSAAINGSGNALSNVISGNAASNILSGGTGNDTLIGGAGRDTLNGGAGNDTYHLYAETTDIIYDASGVDTITSTISRSLAGYTVIENLTLLGTAVINGTGNALSNIISGNAGANTLSGGGGNDTLIGGAGRDTLNGGAGNDIYHLHGETTDIVVDASGIDTITSTVARSLAGYAAIENLTLLGSAAINGAGNALNNVISGNAAANVLSGGAGNDTLIGGAGRDTLNGGAGNDTYHLYAETTDVIYDASGTDTITSTVSRSLAGHATIERLTLVGSAAINGSGNALNNVISGNAAANMLFGGSGNDTLSGGAGNDTLEGGAGVDTLQGGSGIDRFVYRQSQLSSVNADRIMDFGAEDYIYFDVSSGPTGVLAASAFRAGANALDADDRFIYNATSRSLYYDQDGNGATAKTLVAVFDKASALAAADIILF